MKAIEIRNKYLNFFKNHGHSVIPSASLIPENDPSVLFTTAGMQPLVPYLLGEKHPALEIPKIDIKLKPVNCFKDRWDNFCMLWLNHEFYEKYKDSAGLKEIKKQIKKTQLS